MAELSAADRIVLAIDTTSQYEAEYHMSLARRFGAKQVKFGSALAAVTGWRFCSDLAYANGVEWIADAQLHDRSLTVGTIANTVCRFDYPPAGITVHAAAGRGALLAARVKAKGTKVIGVTGVPAMPPAETEEVYGVSAAGSGLSLGRIAARAGVTDLLVTPQEIAAIKEAPETSGLTTIVEGAYARTIAGAPDSDAYGVEDALRVGADMVVVGDQVWNHRRPVEAFQAVIAEVEAGLAAR